MSRKRTRPGEQDAIAAMCLASKTAGNGSHLDVLREGEQAGNNNAGNTPTLLAGWAEVVEAAMDDRRAAP